MVVFLDRPKGFKWQLLNMFIFIKEFIYYVRDIPRKEKYQKL